ncbi:cytidyltransferase [Brevibacillus sp. NRS-1366]|uniref:cytidyltransferase n=1 Tax=Brevibacillus sp. NRS-1366 TaxID=3233899 RepID=UPI003D1DA4A5
MKTVYVTHCSESFVAGIEPCVMALGFFDGVHLGHRQLIHHAKQLAQKRNLKLALLTFYPHPKEVISQEKVTFNYLTPLAVKEEIFAQLGVEILYVIRFDWQFARVSPKDFIHWYIIGLRAEHVVAGFDFTYGYLGKGNMKTIEADGMGMFRVSTIPKVNLAGRKISSTIIRESLLAGDVGDIPQYLGDFYETRGEAVLLNTRERRKGGIQAEVTPHQHYTLPADGAYEVEVRIDRHICRGTAYVSKRNDGAAKLEMKLFYPYKKAFNKTLAIKWLNKADCVEKSKERVNESVH